MTNTLSSLLYPQQLLHIVRQKASQGVVDATLKFTLSALWNLTDESPTTCRHFIENQGLDLFIKVLEVHSQTSTCICENITLYAFMAGCLTVVLSLPTLTTSTQSFPNESSIQQKVLGLLVSPLRCD